MIKEFNPSTDELFVEFKKIVERLDLIENLMRDHARACGDVIGIEAVEFFADNIERNVFSVQEFLTDIKLAMDVEAHRKI